MGIAVLLGSFQAGIVRLALRKVRDLEVVFVILPAKRLDSLARGLLQLSRK
jgi:hypothetical protein